MLSILIVEDEKTINDLILQTLRSEGYFCVQAFDGAKAADLIEKERFDLVILDLMLPEISGYELLSYIRPLGTPVIILSAMGRPDDRIRGLKMGADDYLAKPFQIGELSARVEAVLRRTGQPADNIVFRDIVVEPSSRRVLRAGKPVEMTNKELDLLIVLLRNRNMALSRSFLYESVWKEEYTGQTRTLDSHIQRLRKKLGLEDEIRTLFRIGYRLEDLS